MDSQIQDGEVQITEPNRDVRAEIPVLIVGGGPVGLTSSLLLSHHGVRSLLVEQHPGTSTYPKARLFKTRMMEIFRQLGIEQAVREVAIPHNRNLIFARSLAGEELHRRPIEGVLPEFVGDWSPTSGCTCTQDVVEPVLFDYARRYEQAQIRFNTQLTSFEQRDDHVLATLVHRPTGRVQHVRARYLIGADGAHSPVRQALGVRMLGQPVLSYAINVLFRADLSRWVGDREINICIIVNPEAPGLLLHNGGNHWRFSTFYYPDQGQRPEDFTPEHCLQIIRKAMGVPDLAVEVGDITAWNEAALVAERFHDHRVFLAGDATHVMSPMGGFALNVGVEDAHNLAWKLAAVLKGWAPHVLLNSYEVERAPASRTLIDYSAHNSGSIHTTSNGGANASPVQPLWSRPELAREHGLVFGMLYNSRVIVPDGTTPIQVANPITDYKPNARPGSRAPHVWLERAGERISTLDLFGREFVLLAGAEGQSWSNGAKEAARVLRVPLQVLRVDDGGELRDVNHTWAETYGIAEDGAVLVRPDGYVAWRCATSKAEPETGIERALATALGRHVIQQIAKGA